VADSDSNKALVARARLGDPAALEALVRRHLRAACAVALAVLGSPADAEDVAQDSFVVAFERLETCRDPERFAGWFLQIVRNRALNAKAQQKLRGQAAGALAEPEPHLDAPDAGRAGLRDRLLKGLSEISATQREVVLLHDLEGWTHGEIARALEISEVMSRQHLFTARRALRTLLGDEAPSAEVRHE